MIELVVCCVLLTGDVIGHNLEGDVSRMPTEPIGRSHDWYQRWNDAPYVYDEVAGAQRKVFDASGEIR